MPNTFIKKKNRKKKEYIEFINYIDLLKLLLLLSYYYNTLQICFNFDCIK